MSRAHCVLGPAMGLVLVLAGCGAASSPGTTARAGSGRSPSPADQPAPPKRLVARLAPGLLPAPVSGEAAAPTPGGVLVIGGVDAADTSVSTVSRIAAPGRTVAPAGTLATPLHDAAAVTLGNRVLLFGGGAATTIASVEALAPPATARVIGSLPGPRSDLSAVVIDGRAFVLGGFDGTSTVAPVLETTNGASFRQVSSLRVPVRYAAVAAVGHTIYALGGELADGSDTDVIQAVDVRTGKTTVVGRIPQPLSHGSAIALGGKVYLLGGRVGGVNGKPVDRIVSFDPGTGRVSSAGRLPMPVTNATATTQGGVGYLAGGLGSSGAPLRSVVTLRLEAVSPAG